MAAVEILRVCYNYCVVLPTSMQSNFVADFFSVLAMPLRPTYRRGTRGDDIERLD